MNLNDFDFLLPDELIADRPVSPRSSSRLLVSKTLEQFIDEKFYNLPFNFSRGSFYLGYKGEMHQI